MPDTITVASCQLWPPLTTHRPQNSMKRFFQRKGIVLHQLNMSTGARSCVPSLSWSWQEGAYREFFMFQDSGSTVEIIKIDLEARDVRGKAMSPTQPPSRKFNKRDLFLHSPRLDKLCSRRASNKYLDNINK